MQLRLPNPSHTVDLLWDLHFLPETALWGAPSRAVVREK